MDISKLSGVGEKRAEALRAAGIATVADLLNHFPRDYDDRTRIKTIAELTPDAVNTIRGVVAYDPENADLRRKGAANGGKGSTFTVTKVMIKDHTGTLELTWYNQPYLKKHFKKGSEYIFTGKVRSLNFGGVGGSSGALRVQMQSPDYEATVAGGVELSGERIVPLYTAPKQYSQKTFRALMYQALELADKDKAQDANGNISTRPNVGVIGAFFECLPAGIRSRFNLCDRRCAVQNIHFPESDELFLSARRRLVFEELFFMQLTLLNMKRAVAAQPGVALADTDYSPFLRELPFAPTGAQMRVLDEIAADMGRLHKGASPSDGQRMNRLIQGDVGSGKTAVAMASAYLAMKNGFQAALMAPTDVLAGQHFTGCTNFFTPLGYETVLLTGSLGAKARREALAKIEDGRAAMIVGTHALIQPSVVYHNLGLCITDEQHRFGVNQRLSLTQKGTLLEVTSVIHENAVIPSLTRNPSKEIADQSCNNGQRIRGGTLGVEERIEGYVLAPHTLVMTATPIPRTLGLILYGDLDISVIDELPPGRQEIKTYCVDSRYRERVRGFIRKETDQGRQVYIVCSAIEENMETVDSGGTSPKVELQYVLNYTRELSEALPGLIITHLHGRMKPAEKDQIMTAFKAGEIQVLVSTTVIEVGVHVANATLMIIENAERFGLSQLHQLRGRVGRGAEQSYCVMITDSKNNHTKTRMKAMTQTTDGFKLAELDLEQRGAGDFFGTRQHGLPTFAIANLYRDMDILKEAQDAAQHLDRFALSPQETAILQQRIDEVTQCAEIACM